ncbi:hypothetical protein [uncultured Desulfobacter sp.]|uniref:hypothetical protein n=1 Tax=uncultured Desulfobacter sp. TaxID=240139 RepID=UPI002AABE80C|nr:hypothetical protein [uncultured Desulfobacter sp.]
MKIDTFSVELNSSRTYSQTQTVVSSETYSFTDILDARASDVSDNGDAEGSSPGGNGSLTWQEMGEVSLTEQFKQELNTLRQMTKAILDVYMPQVTNTAQARLTSLNQVYTGQVFQWDFSLLSQWEHTRTTTVTYEESEQVTVSGGGTIHTADNRQIDFSMDLLMERQFFSESNTQETETGYMLIDPLVIQTDARMPMLQGGQFSFDLDGDGDTEDLAGLSQGYAFLALDLNQDGIINDGSELFGPATGDGFRELAEYDQDRNMWIDENDEMFDQFVLWNPGTGDGTRLTRLADAGIGAVYLGEVSSLFSLSDGENQMAGQITDTSLALSETGDVLPVYEMNYLI